MFSRSTVLGACLVAGALSIPSLLSAQETKQPTNQTTATQETAKQDAAKPDAPWHVAKTSGEVWVTGTGVQAVSLTDQTELKAGDFIRTGKSGRVLLTRGNETLLLAPNSAIALPQQAKDGMTTTIEQAAGSILLDVEHRDVQHFEVVTPFLAAVVKGTQFRVTVSKRGGQVEVTRGQVQVSDFKSGQFALVLPGQTAGVGAKGSSGLVLSGSGSLSPVQQGQPRSSDIKLIRPEHGSLPPPRDLGPAKATRLITAKGEGLHPGAAPLHVVLVDSARANVSRASGTRITAPLGEVHVNFQKVTNGLAHDTSAHQTAKNGQQGNMVWGSSGGSLSGNGSGAGGVSVVAGAGSPSVSSGVGAQIGAANKANNGNGNNGNGNNGNGNGNGNGGVGNGNGKGNGKH